MRKTAAVKTQQKDADEMRPHYDFDYGKARPNRFAGRLDKSRLVVALDPDISEVFTTPESVNKVLRALITTMPKKIKPKAVRKTAPRAGK